MTSINVPLDGFPNLDRSKRTSWAPILCHPKEASWETFVIGIVAIDSDCFHIEVANRLARLGCLYEEKAMPIALSIEMAIGWLEEVLSAGEAKLEDIVFPVSNVALGDCQVATGIQCKEVAKQWMGSLSSFYEPLKVGEVVQMREEISEIANAISAQPSRLPVQVLNMIEKRSVKLLQYFHEDVRNRSSRRVRANARVKIDYDGMRLSANIDSFNFDAPSKTVGQLKQRLWDLAVQRDRSTESRNPHKDFEMLVEFPKHRLLDKSPKSVERIVEHLRELSAQADREEIRLRKMSSPNEICEHILKVENA